MFALCFQGFAVLEGIGIQGIYLLVLPALHVLDGCAPVSHNNQGQT